MPTGTCSFYRAWGCANIHASFFEEYAALSYLAVSIKTVHMQELIDKLKAEVNLNDEQAQKAIKFAQRIGDRLEAIAIGLCTKNRCVQRPGPGAAVSSHERSAPQKGSIRRLDGGLDSLPGHVQLSARRDVRQ